MLELDILPRRFDAIRNRVFPNEHRQILSNTKFNQNGHPIVNGSVAGINACNNFLKYNKYESFCYWRSRPSRLACS